MSLTCSASGSPPINYRWYKEGPGGEAKELWRGAMLAFDNLQVLDSARYFCTAENRLNVQKEQSISFQLTVKGEDASEISRHVKDCIQGWMVHGKYFHHTFMKRSRVLILSINTVQAILTTIHLTTIQNCTRKSNCHRMVM